MECKDSYVAATRQPVVVEADSEIEIENLVLLRPLDLELRISPATDMAGESWKLMLLNLTARESAGTGATDPEGRWTLPGLSPGKYLLFVANSLGKRMAEEAIDLAPGQTSFEIELRIVWVDGEVSLGDEPLAAKVTFGGVSGGTSIPMASDEQGRFSGWVPREGSWDVDVTCDDPPVFRRFRDVEVKTNEATGIAHVELRLPDTLLEGEVVDDQGRPMPGAAVVIVPIPAVENVSYSHTDGDGRFAVRGYVPGLYRLEARVQGPAGTLVSGTVEIELAANAPTASAQLVVRQMQQLRGRVVSEAGGVAGAAILLSELETQGLPGMVLPRAETGIDGTFTVEVPAQVRAATLTVLAAGFVLHRQPLVIEPGIELPIALQRQGGTLVFRLPESPGEQPRLPRLWVVHDGGSPIDIGLLHRWAGINGLFPSASEIVVPFMPPGSYTVCWRPTPKDEAPADEVCEHGSLAPSLEWMIDLAPDSDDPDGGETLEAQPPKGDAK